MVSDVDFSKSFGYWWESTKWTGLFKIKWIYVKDLQYSAVNKITFGDKPVTQHRDGTKLDFETGMKMLKVFEKTETTDSIFNEFGFMDEREEKMRVGRDLEESVIENNKSNNYQGHGHRDYGHRHGRDRHRDNRDRDEYRKSNKYSGNDYHPRKKDHRPRDTDYQDDKDDEHLGGIVIQKKTAKSKKTKNGKGPKKAVGEKKETEAPAKPTDPNDKVIDVPSADN